MRKTILFFSRGNEVHIFYRAWDKRNKSTVGYAKLDGPLKVVERKTTPSIQGERKYEHSIEDPRVVLLDGTYYMTYVAYSGRRINIALATSKDLIHWKKQGIISSLPLTNTI